MSYDLDIEFESPVEKTEFWNFLQSRKHYFIDSDDFGYQNDQTGVYFTISTDYDVNDDEDRNYENKNEIISVICNINYCRPGFFAVEMAREITALLARFPACIDDPQMDGMGSGPYTPAGLLKGWNAGNIAAIHILSSRQDPFRYALPRATLMRCWEWNDTLDARQQRLGDAKAIPKMSSFALDEKILTAAIWVDGMPIMLPRVDYVLMARRQDDGATQIACLSWADLVPVLLQAGHAQHDGFDVSHALAADTTSALLASGQPFDPDRMCLLNADKVLDEESVSAARA
ncbi:hypothetical protein CFR75_14280 [Komagataeibacter xylinus]|uniref:Uncharacterized protein n=2 Tax=Komagataeibacter xylinus TaxID=28448 RepID=A0A318PF61_KOMXY|nr:hypothetical protein [Komagataeibacter xylinus]PYD55841.1 hypothetical protein CFR75_14280 [Komagataeibacter xylinus]GBQ70321.1 hypothetical protein AA15237_0842 [Komagataeibacter xylinus NBRC 15237]